MVSVQRRSRSDSNTTAVRQDRQSLTSQVVDLTCALNEMSIQDDAVHIEIMDRLDKLDRDVNELYWYALGAVMIIVVILVAMIVRSYIPVVGG